MRTEVNPNELQTEHKSIALYVSHFIAS